MLIKIGAIVILLLFFTLAGYAVWTMQVAIQSMRRTTEAVNELQKQLHSVGEESLQLIRSMHKTVDALDDQLQSAATLTASARQIGETVRYAADSASHIVRAWTDSVLRRIEPPEDGQDNRLNQWLDWTGMGLGLWHQWHQRQHPQTNAKGEKKQ